MKSSAPENSGYIPGTKSAQYASMKVSDGKSLKTDASDEATPTRPVGSKAGEAVGYNSYEKSAGQ